MDSDRVARIRGHGAAFLTCCGCARVYTSLEIVGASRFRHRFVSFLSQKNYTLGLRHMRLLRTCAATMTPFYNAHVVQSYLYVDMVPYDKGGGFDVLCAKFRSDINKYSSADGLGNVYLVNGGIPFDARFILGSVDGDQVVDDYMDVFATYTLPCCAACNTLQTPSREMYAEAQRCVAHYVAVCGDVDSLEHALATEKVTSICILYSLIRDAGFCDRMGAHMLLQFFGLWLRARKYMGLGDVYSYARYLGNVQLLVVVCTYLRFRPKVSINTYIVATLGCLSLDSGMVRPIIDFVRVATDTYVRGDSDRLGYTMYRLSEELMSLTTKLSDRYRQPVVPILSQPAAQPPSVAQQQPPVVVAAQPPPEAQQQPPVVVGGWLPGVLGSVVNRVISAATFLFEIPGLAAPVAAGPVAAGPVVAGPVSDALVEYWRSLYDLSDYLNTHLAVRRRSRAGGTVGTVDYYALVDEEMEQFQVKRDGTAYLAMIHSRAVLLLRHACYSYIADPVLSVSAGSSDVRSVMLLCQSMMNELYRAEEH